MKFILKEDHDVTVELKEHSLTLQLLASTAISSSAWILSIYNGQDAGNIWIHYLREKSHDH